MDLPTELVLALDDEQDPSLDLADMISDETGWCVNGFNYEVVN